MPIIVGQTPRVQRSAVTPFTPGLTNRFCKCPLRNLDPNLPVKDSHDRTTHIFVSSMSGLGFGCEPRMSPNLSSGQTLARLKHKNTFQKLDKGGLLRL